MPFDEDPTDYKTDVFSLEGLIAWLEKQDPKAEYDFFDCKGGCLLDQYLASHGFEVGESCVGARNYDQIAGARTADGRNLGGAVAGPAPSTYGAALERARAAL